MQSGISDNQPAPIMNIKSILTAFALICGIGFSSPAQSDICVLPKTTWKDTTRVEILYGRSFFDSSLKERKTDLYILEIGSRNLNFRSINKFREDSIYKDIDSSAITWPEYWRMQPQRYLDVDSESLWTDMTDKILTESNRCTLNNIFYNESIPEIKWTFVDTTKIYEDHLCKKAVTDFRGRRWVAWYTEDIPISYGPWKLHGLPGMILHAGTPDKDETINIFAVLIREGGNPMGVGDISATKVSRKRYLEFLREMYKEGGKNESIKTLTRTPDGQSLPYIPPEEYFYVPLELDY